MLKKSQSANSKKRVIFPSADSVKSMPNSPQTTQTPTPVTVVAPSEKEKQQKKLTNLIKHSNRVLFETSAVFPFDFFPDRIVIDENKINIIHGVFFYSNTAFTILLEDVKNTFLTYNPLFASLNIEMTSFERNTEQIKYLKKADAQKAHRIIMGLATCRKEGIDITRFDAEELLPKIEKIGATTVN